MKFARIALAVMTAAAFGIASAQDAYPTKSVTMVVPFPPGGGTDTGARWVAQKLSEKWGQPVVVDNKAGAAGMIGADFVSRAKPDGYTIMMANAQAVAINPSLYKKLPYNPDTAFVPISLVAELPLVLLVNSSLPVNNTKEFITLAKSKELTYGSAGNGSSTHLAASLFDNATGTKLVHVPYKGTAPALNDIIASHVDFIFMELASAIKLHQADKARILAVATDKRIPSLPDIPTLAEAGVKDFESGTWNAMAAPPKTPAAIVAKLNKAVNEVLQSPEAQDHFAKINLRAAGGSPAEAAAFIKKETAVWGGVIKDANVEAH